MRIAIVGAGPAGAWTARLLATRGHDVSLLDSQAPWEKPCGGGVTARALTRFGIFDSDLPRENIDRVTIYFGDEASVVIIPQRPLAVVSRRNLGQYLIDSATRAGVSIIKTRATRLEREGRRWTITTRDSQIKADFIVGADGASSFVRRSVSEPLSSDDLSVTLGYFIPAGGTAHMKIYFVPSLEGYVWSFPRPTHLSYGLVTRTEPGWTSRAKTLLHNFIQADLGQEALEQAEFYSAPIPCLGSRAWALNQVAGDGWALVGEAAGFADPLTGEGIYFAFRSAEILAEAFPTMERYASMVWSDFGSDLARAAHMYRRFYRGRFAGGDFRKRTIQIARRSRTVRTVLGDLVTGSQPYLQLKKRLLLAAPSVTYELIRGVLVRPQEEI